MTNERNRDRSHRPTTHRRLEVLEPMANTLDDGESRTPEKIAELFAIAGRETETIEQLTGCVARQHEVQAANAQLVGLTSAEVRAALELRPCDIGEAQ
jgi:hypothetical protein